MPFPKDFYHWSQKIGRQGVSEEFIDELEEDGYQMVFLFTSEDGLGDRKFENFVNDMITWLNEQEFDGWIAYQEVDHEVIEYCYRIFLKDDSEILAFHLAWYGNFVSDLFPLKRVV